ncbi:MAG: hypothetical protein GY746_16985, partial [Gammaproteobacteria bacterium]|nr:hypothetical protein [Gammaproteobacteria bacterium]
TTASGHSVANNFEVRYEPTSSSDVKGSSLRFKAITADGTNTDFTSFLQGLRFSLIHRNNGTVNQLIGGRFQMGMPTGAWGGSGTSGTINSLKGIDMELYSMKGTTNYATGISVETIGTNFSNMTYLRINQQTDVAGNFGIYNNSSYDNYFAGNVGIGTSAPDTTLHIVGNIKMEDGNEAAGRLLTSDANGLMTWTDPASISTASIFELYGDTVRLDTSVVDITAANFVFGSPQLDYDGDPDHDIRMFFDKNKGAFRAGRTNETNWDTDSLGLYSVAFGNNTKATGDYSTAMGWKTEAVGQFSTAMGLFTKATGFNSTAMGLSTSATGERSTAMGNHTAAKSLDEMTIGSHNTNYTPNSTEFWYAADRLFVIGNGTSNGRSDAMVVLKNGNTGFGTSTPENTMHIVGGLRYEDGTEAAGFIPVSDADGVMTWTDPASITTSSIFANTSGVTSNENGTYASDDFVFGSPQLDDDANANHDKRMFFDKGKGAFRAGRVTGTNWDTDSLGLYSVAFGNNTKATGNYSTAMGSYTIATGDYSTAMGNYSDAQSAYETALGSYNTNYTPNSTTAWDAADRLFVIGNGTSSERSDAMMVLKNGHTGFGTSTPDTTMHIVGGL